MSMYMKSTESGTATKYSRDAFNAYTVKCAVCGKEFIRAPGHMYKDVITIKDGKRKYGSAKTVWFCRYNHYVQWMKDHGKW